VWSSSKTYFSSTFFPLDGDQYNTEMTTGSLRSLCISVQPKALTLQLILPGENSPIHQCGRTSLIQNMLPDPNAAVRWIRTVSQDKISGKQAGEQWVMALRQFTCQDSLQTWDFWERETDVSICTDCISLFFIHHSS